MHEGFDSEFAQLVNDVDDLRVADIGAVLLERKPEHIDPCTLDVAAREDHLLHRLARDVRPHAVIDTAASEDYFRVVAEQFRLVRQIIGIDAYAVPADQPGTEGHEVPLGAGRGQDFRGVEAELVEDDGELVDEGDVEVPLRVLNHLGGFGHANRRHPVNPCTHHRRVQVSDLFERFGIVPRNNLDDPGEAVLPVARIDAFGGIADVEILAPSHAGLLLEDRHANLFGGPWIDGRLVDYGRARFQMPADRDAG